MLEALTPEALRTKLGLEDGNDGAPAIGSVADAARDCIRAWRSPPRARVTAYLHRQFLAAGFTEESVRSRVGDVVDALIDVGDVTPVRLTGKASLVLSRPQWVGIAADDYAFLGQADPANPVMDAANGYVRRAATLSELAKPIDFSDFLGVPGYRRHLARRTAGTGDGTLAELWATLRDVLQHDGQPLDAGQLRAVIDPPSTDNGYFGRHNQPTVSGRWKTVVPEGQWCAVRPGRNANEWHPVVIQVTGSEVRSLDLFDWDEWNWALLARGSAIGEPERASWSNGRLAFEYPAPTQYRRALRLLGRPGLKSWTWEISEGANAAFARWRETAL